ncbi:MAG: hypothetical protein MJZ59_05730 [Paludibacteraceae bacterium]|nr:hypothetical protein [Paludibacteraceae bacterium]
MKKLFIFSVLVLTTMTMNAQITYVATLKNVNLEFSNLVEPWYLPEFGEFTYSVDETAKTITLYNDQFKADKVVTIPNVSQANDIHVYWASIGLFTTDGKICFLVRARFGGTYPNDTYKYMVLNENGIVVESFKDEYPFHYYPTLFSMDGGIYIAFTPDTQGEDNQGDSDIYLLPSTTTDLDSPSAPIRTSNAHKIIENGQMYIILDGVKYAVTGSSM